MENRVYYGEYSLRHWIELILKKNIILPDYQRYFVWNEKKVRTLIDTFKKEQFVPPVTIGAFKKGDESKNLILDGQQRLTSLLLAYLELFPDESIYKGTLEKFTNENDDEEEITEELDNVLEWKLNELVKKGNSKKEILDKTIDGNYKKISFDLDEKFFEKKFLGFSYLVPFMEDEKKQLNYYSSVFRNINIQGEALLPQESRASLYFLDNELEPFFAPKFVKKFKVKGVSSETIIDFVRYLSLLSQFLKDDSPNKVARGYKPKMEKYYEEYIYSVITNTDDKFGKFLEVFPEKKFSERFKRLEEILETFIIHNTYPSIIDLDMYFFGLIYFVVLKDKTLDSSNYEELREKITKQIAEYKDKPSHTKAPSNLGHLRDRIGQSIAIYENYAQ